MALFGLFGNDREMAATRYAGRESATARKQRKEAERHVRRVIRHKTTGATRSARKGQAWEDADRWHEQYGRFSRRR